MTFLRTAVACIAASLALAPLAASQSLTPADILSWEDTDSLILDLWPDDPGGSLDEHDITLITVLAANDILPTIGDNYDFIGFWMNYAPAPWWGPTTAAHYGPIKNSVTGLGTFSGAAPDGTYDFHSDYGLAGSKVQGLLFFTDINTPQWSSSPSTPVNTLKTRLNVSHEYEHRFGNYLPDLLDGRQMQGDPTIGAPGPCGSETHWNLRVDGQGSCLGLSDWIGSNPAVLGPYYGSSHLAENTDIVDGHFSYMDLYLMGMVSSAEVDAGMSEMRYMDDSVDCSSPYFGAISNFAMADIIAAAGPRVPDSTASQKDFKTAWVIIHQPGDPPSPADKEKLIGILNNQQADWSYSTLGRSTMTHTLDPIVWSNLGFELPGIHGDPMLVGSGPLTTGSAGSLMLSNAAGPGALAILFISFASTPTPFKGGTLATVPLFTQFGLSTIGSPGSVTLPWASWPAGLSGVSLYFQYGIQDAAAVKGAALSNALRADVP